MTHIRILTVCTGNICRSPLAEQLLAARLADADVACESAGTAALVGQPMDGRAADYSRAHGGDPSRHRAAQLTPDRVREADLVLAATRAHRRAVVETLPRATQYAFTLREFARLLGGLDADDYARIDGHDEPAGRLGELIASAAAHRGITVPPAAADDDIVDPFRQTDAVYAQSVEQVLAAVERIAPALRRAAKAAEPS